MYMEYSYDEMELSDLELHTSEFRNEVRQRAAKIIEDKMFLRFGTKPVVQRKKIIIFSSGNGMKIAADFGMEISRIRYFQVGSFFGEQKSIYYTCWF